MTTIASMVARLGLDHAPMTAGLKAAAGDIEAFRKQAEGELKKLDAGKDMAASISRFGKKMSLAVTLPVVAATAAVGKLAGDFESSMNLLGVRTNATAGEMDALRAAALKMGAETAFSASDAAAAMSYLAQAGLNVADTIGAVPAVMQLAAAGSLTMADAANALTSILQGSGLGVKDLVRANDVLVKASNTSKVNITDLAYSFKYAGSLAATAGISFEESAAVLALMARAGYDASSAGTALRGIISNLISPTKQQKDIMDELGLSSIASSKGITSLTDVFGALQKSGGDAGKIMTLFGDRAGPALLGVLQQGTGAVVTMENALKQAGGTAKKVADVQMQGLNGAVRELQNSVETLMVAISDAGLLRALTNAARKLGEVIGAVAQLDPAFIKLGLVVAGLAAVTGPLLIALGAIAGAIVKLKVAALLLTGSSGLGALATMALPGGPFILGLVALGLAIYAISKYMRDGADDTRDFRDAIRGLTSDQLELRRVSLSLEKARLQAKIMSGEIKPLAPSARELLGRGGTSADQFDPLVAAKARIGEINTLLQESGWQLRDNASAAAALKAEAEAMALALKNALGAGSGGGAPVDMDEYMKELGAQISRVGAAAEFVKATGTPIAGLWQEVERLTAVATEGLNKYGNGFDKMSTAFRGFLADLNEASRLTLPDLPGVQYTPARKPAMLPIAPARPLTGGIQVPKAPGFADLQFGKAMQQLRDGATLFVARVKAIKASDITGGIGDALQGMMSGLQYALLSAIGPLAILSAVLEPLIPVVQILLAPFAKLGEILATALLPIVKALFPVFRAMAISATYVAEIFFRIVAGITTVLGAFLVGVGKLINKLPGSLGDPIIRAGEGIQAFAAASYASADAMKRGRDELKALTFDDAAAGVTALGAAATETANSVRNLPQWFRLEDAIQRSAAPRLASPPTTGTGTGLATPPATPSGGGVVINGPITISTGGGTGDGGVMPAVRAQENARSVVRELRRLSSQQFGTPNRWSDVSVI